MALNYWRTIAVFMFGALVQFGSQECNAQSLRSPLVFNVSRNGDAILVPVRVGQNIHQFLLDTGASYNAIDPRLRDRVTLRTGTPSPHQSNLLVYACQECTLDGSDNVVTGGFIVQDLESIRVVSGLPIDGVIGVEFLSQLRIHYDGNQGVLRLENSSDDSVASGVRIEVDGRGRPLCEIDVGVEEKTSFVIDTGMILPGLGEMEKSLFERLLRTGKITQLASPAKVQTVNETRTSRKGQIEKIQFGKDSFSQLGIREGTFNGVGMDFLGRYNFVLDIGRRRFWSQPSTRFNSPLLFDMSGLSIVKIDGKLMIIEVKPSSPAEDLGIKTGDQVLSVDGRSTEQTSLHEVRILLANPNVEIAIELLRKGEKLKLAIPLRNWQNARMPLAAR